MPAGTVSRAEELIAAVNDALAQLDLQRAPHERPKASRGGGLDEALFQRLTALAPSIDTSPIWAPSALVAKERHQHAPASLAALLRSPPSA